MMWIYRLLFLPVLLLSLPYYGYRMLKRGGYRHDFHHRFGLMDRPKPKPQGTTRVWIQAVSVGEVKAIAPLLQTFEEMPNVEVVLTTTTSTGYAIASKAYANTVLKTGVFPIDFYPFSRSAWRRIDADLAILMEGELWPEHLRQAKKRGVPVVLINARLSDRSFRRYSKVKPVARRILKNVSLVVASSDADAERFKKIGAKQVDVSGNLKFDVLIKPLLSERERTVMRQEMGLESRIKETRSPMRPPMTLLGSSTWPGEEQMLIELLEEALQEGVNLRLLLVPRHEERRDEIIKLLKNQSRKWHIRSQGTNSPEHVRIYLADTTGELALLSQLADIVFIGKSLPPNDGGQTPIEAGALGLPIVYGPNMSNFRPLCRSLEASGAALKCRSSAEVKIQLLRLLRQHELRHKMRIAAQEWHDKNQGATLRTIDHIKRYFK